MLAGALNRTRRGPNMIGSRGARCRAVGSVCTSARAPIGAAMGGAARPTRVYGSGEFGPITARRKPPTSRATCRARALRRQTARRRHARRRALDPRGRRRRARVGWKSWSTPTRNAAGHRPSALHDRARCGCALCRRTASRRRPRRLSGARPGVSRPDRNRRAPAGRDRDGPAPHRPAVGILQPDLAMVGGFTEALRIARVAGAFGVQVAPHFLPGPLRARGRGRAGARVAGGVSAARAALHRMARDQMPMARSRRA